jgi:hypothetical protein
MASGIRSADSCGARICTWRSRWEVKTAQAINLVPDDRTWLSRDAGKINLPRLALRAIAVFGERKVVAKAKIAKLEPASPRPNTRRVSRRIAEAVATIRASNGERCRARIRDVSVFGCSLACDAAWLRAGMFVTVQLTSDWSIPAVVRWAREGMGGVEFLRPISDADAREIACE